MQFWGAKNVSHNTFPVNGTSSLLWAIPQFCVLHTGKILRGLLRAFYSDFTQVTAGLLQVISKHYYSSNSIDPKKHATWGKSE